MGAIIFLSVTVFIALFGCKMLFIAIRVRHYIKNNYPDFWQSKQIVLGGGSYFGGANIFEQVKELADPKMDDYKKQWEKALKQLLWVVLFCVILIAIYIFFLEANRRR